MKRKPLPEDDEAARLLDAYLRHVEAEAPEHKPDEKIVLALPDTAVAERKRNAITTPAQPTKKKRNRARADR